MLYVVAERVTRVLLVEVVISRAPPRIALNALKDAFLVVVNVRKVISLKQLERKRHIRKVLVILNVAHHRLRQTFAIAEPRPRHQPMSLCQAVFASRIWPLGPFLMRILQCVGQLFINLAVFVLRLELDADAFRANNVINKTVEHTARKVVVLIKMSRLTPQRFGSPPQNSIA